MPAASPTVFFGHGSPMNASENNVFTNDWAEFGERITSDNKMHLTHKEIPNTDKGTLVYPNAVLVISAHWATQGVCVTMNPLPRTIHDYSGFPPELSQVEYPAPGSPALAQHVTNLLREFVAPEPISVTTTWGLDHGTWSVLRHVFPEANVPVVQMSIDISKPAAWHLQVARKLQTLRDYQVLIVGSGNIVHNLGAINWTDNAEPHPSSIGFHKYIVEAIENNDINAIVNYASHPDAAYAVPTPEHFLPLLYVLGARRPNEAPHTVTDGFVYSSLSMYSVAFG